MKDRTLRRQISNRSRRDLKPSGRGNQKGTICKNAACKLRKAGCKGYEGCPGFIKK